MLEESLKYSTVSNNDMNPPEEEIGKNLKTGIIVGGQMTSFPKVVGGQEPSSLKVLGGGESLGLKAIGGQESSVPAGKHGAQNAVWANGLDREMWQASEKGLEEFLASSFVKGVGKVFARRIVGKVGFAITDPSFDFYERLGDVAGLSPTKIIEIRESFKALKYPPKLLAFLFSTGLSETDIEKILSHYKKHTEDVIIEDPYQMVEEVFKLSFFTADKIGRYMGISGDDPRRLRGALLTAVKIYAEQGSIFAREDEAVVTASRISGADTERIRGEIASLVKDERLIRSHEGLYLPVYYKAEKEGAEKLASLITGYRPKGDIYEIPEKDLEGHPLSEAQKYAIKTVMENPVTVITGGPGTGKTTAVRGIIQLMEDGDREVVLAAPTGRAAKRLSDLSGREAQTLHRLLGYTGGRGYRNKHISADILIIDEASMLEQVMFNHLLQALDKDTRIVLVGDTDQLPAIGAGDVLRDMIKSGTVPVISLEENFRQKAGSLIVRNASSIRNGEMLAASEGNDFIFISEESPRRIHDRLLSLVAREIPEKYHIPSKDIQVVTPQQEGPLGAKQLNLDIQSAVNAEAQGIKHGQKTFRLGDRVMQTSNSSQRHTFNGETGWVSCVDPSGQWLEVTFSPEKISRYFKRELKELSLAYATTIHKLQGSETDFMVMPMSMSHRPMLYRNLLYTGVSRAKKLCAIVGEEKAIKTAVENPSPAIRNSNFRHRLREQLPMLRRQA